MPYILVNLLLPPPAIFCTLNDPNSDLRSSSCLARSSLFLLQSSLALTRAVFDYRFVSYNSVSQFSVRTIVAVVFGRRRRRLCVFDVLSSVAKLVPKFGQSAVCGMPRFKMIARLLFSLNFRDRGHHQYQAGLPNTSRPSMNMLVSATLHSRIGGLTISPIDRNTDYHRRQIFTSSVSTAPNRGLYLRQSALAIVPDPCSEKQFHIFNALAIQTHRSRTGSPWPPPAGPPSANKSAL